MPSDYINFFLECKSTVVQFETVELSHPNFSKVHRIVRNKTNGLTATLEDDSIVIFEYYPLKFDHGASQDDLEYVLDITFGDLGELLPTELDLIQAAGGFTVKPILKYRTFRSDDLTQPMVGPVSLEIVEISFNKTGATFQAKAPSLSVNKTGENYTIARFPSLRSVL